MTQPAGRTLSLTPAHRFMGELLKDTRRVPTAMLRRSLQLAAVAAARQAARPRPSWCAVFTKAYGGVAAAQPELRRVYRDWPWPHLYEHAGNVAAVAVTRRLEGEGIVCFAHLRQPQEQRLEELDQELRRVKRGAGKSALPGGRARSA